MSEMESHQLLDAKEVKRLLKCSLPLVYKLAQRKQIPCIRIPCPGEGSQKPKSLVRFKRNDVLMFIEKHYQKERLMFEKVLMLGTVRAQVLRKYNSYK